MINWQKSKRKWNSLRMPVNRKGLPDGLMQRFLVDVETHQRYKTKWPSRQFSWKLTRGRHLCFGVVTWPRFRENCRKDWGGRELDSATKSGSNWTARITDRITNWIRDRITDRITDRIRDRITDRIMVIICAKKSYKEC